jgi:V/A-type H+/Na+-transporting ATPase subunit D
MGGEIDKPRSDQMEQVSATRSELLARRARLELARRGRALLEEKRDQLMLEFRRAADQVLAQAGELDQIAAGGRRALALAEVADGPEAVRSAALTTRRGIRLAARPVIVAGVHIAEIEFQPVARARFARGYTAGGSSAHIDAVASAFEAITEQMLRLAAYEVRLRRLTQEIGVTNRRVNALATVVIPQLEAETRLILTRLEERERQEIYRLKRIKERKGARLEVRAS